MPATTFTWTGAKSSDWNTPSNWNIGAVPSTVAPNSPTADAIDTIAAEVILGGGATDVVNSLTVGGMGHVIVGGGPAIDGGGGGTLTASSAISVTSTNSGGGLVGGPATTITTPSLTLGAGAIIGGGGAFNIAALANSGVIQADGGDFALGPLKVTGNSITGTGSLEIDGPSTLELNSATAETITVSNYGTANVSTLILDTPSTFTGTLNLHDPATRLNLFLQGQAPTGASYNNNTHHLDITNASGTVIDSIPLVSNGTVYFTGSPTSSLPGFGEVMILGASPTQGFAATDTTTGQPPSATPQPYTGPVSGIQEQFITTNPDNLNIGVSTPGWFIHSGAGADAISAASGINVLDGGPGSNFLTGGSGTDTFFVDDRKPPSDIWSTVNNFHVGDAATIFGITPTSANIAFADGQGAAGYTGLTLHATTPGQPTASLTLVGYTSADLNNGRLTVSYGTETDGTAYMFIHGNK